MNDQPYYVFCLPYSNDITVMNGATKKYQMSKDLSISMGIGMTSQVGKENVYDVQLLPFCPALYAKEAFSPTPGWDGEKGGVVGGIDYTSITTPYIFDESKFSGLYNPIVKYTKTGDTYPVKTNEEVGKLFWVANGNFSFDIPFNIPTKDNALDIKVASETELYRLCSPNYSGVFEFDPYMNNGIESFNVDCSYKPYSPYIHVNPNFKYLYGSDFNDQRGLIIQGDFSLPLESNAWAQYELSNKNYLSIFNRQIQNMKTTQDVERNKQIFQATMGTIGGGAAGAVMGAKGGIAGAIAGAAVGTTAGAIGGALDVKYGDVLRNEALDYTKDMFNYSLDNIKALPNSISKTNPLTSNFKYFPFIEYYTCTPTEKEAFRNKLKYNGMTVMAIGKVEDYLEQNIEWSPYIKGKLIRVEGIEDDYHVINAIAGELDKGAYFE